MNKIKFGAICFSILMVSGVMTFDSLMGSQVAYGVGAWNGQDRYHVPVAWCTLQGSPAEDDPDITHTSHATGNESDDTTTNMVLWRRHERPSEEKFIADVGITFRSGILWHGATVFPNILQSEVPTLRNNDGDIDTLNDNEEIILLAALCRDKYDNDLGRVGVGIPTVNVRQILGDVPGQIVLGLGGCAKTDVTDTKCATPHAGIVGVMDNAYLHPGSPDRTLPGGGTVGIQDPWDQLTGHELSHSLGLFHDNTSTQNLMFESVQDNNADGLIDNWDLNAGEISALRENAQIVGGLEIDPPNVIFPGDIVQQSRMDKVKENNLPSYIDILEVTASLDTKTNSNYIDISLLGNIPAYTKPSYYILIDFDDTSGGTSQMTKDLGVPVNRFNGADIVGIATIKDGKVNGEAWKFVNDKYVEMTSGFKFVLKYMVIYEQTMAVPFGENGPKIDTHERSVANTILGLELYKSQSFMQLEQPFTIQVISQDPKLEFIDKNNDKDIGVPFVLSIPEFPQCFPQGTAIPGEKFTVDIVQMHPNVGLHALFSPVDQMPTVITDRNGEAQISFIMPDADDGDYLFTVGKDNSPLTADCEVTVENKDVPPVVPGPFDFFSWWCWILVIVLVIIVIVLLVKLKRK